MPSWLDQLQRAALLLTAFLFSAGYATVGLALLLLTVVVEAALARRLPWRRTPADPAVVAFLGVFVVSGYLSEFRPTAVASTGLAAVTIYLALGVPSRLLARDGDLLVRLLWAWLAGAALAGGWAIALHLRTGGPAFTPQLGQNAVGTAMLIGAVLGLGLFLSVPTAWRYAAAGMTAIALGALALSYTRGAWLGAGCSLGLVLAAGGRPAARRMILLVAVIALAGTVLAGAERSALVRRARSIPDLVSNADRVYLFRAAGAIARDHPVFGTGMNTFALLYPRYRLAGDPNPEVQPFAHNIFLNIAAEGGLLALASFVAVAVQAGYLGWRWRGAAATEGEAVVRLAILAAFAGMMVHQLVDSTLLSVHLGAGLWIIIAILTAAHP